MSEACGEVVIARSERERVGGGGLRGRGGVRAGEGVVDWGRGGRGDG